MSTPKWPARPADRASRLRTSQRKHKEKVKHRIIDLESRLFATECKLERALAAISTLSDELRAVIEQNKHLQSQRSTSEPVTSNPSSSRVAQISGASSHKQKEHVRKLTLPWEHDANPEDFSWSSAFVEGFNRDGNKNIKTDSAITTHVLPDSVSEVEADVGTVASNQSATGTSIVSTISQSDTDTPASAQSHLEKMEHESYDTLDLAAMRDWIDPKFEKTYGRPDSDKVKAGSLFALMDFISS